MDWPEFVFKGLLVLFLCLSFFPTESRWSVVCESLPFTLADFDHSYRTSPTQTRWVGNSVNANLVFYKHFIILHIPNRICIIPNIFLTEKLTEINLVVVAAYDIIDTEGHISV